MCILTYSHLYRDCYLDKSQRENIRWIALALVCGEKQQISKNDFCRPTPNPKIIF